MTLFLNLRPRYPFTCPSCGDDKHSAGPSIFMSGFQMNVGGATCPSCGEHLRLRIDEKNERMVATKYNYEKPAGQEVAPELPAACYTSSHLVGTFSDSPTSR